MSKDWEVAIIVDPNCDPGTVSTLSSYMPIWVVDTVGNAISVGEARSNKRNCTSFKVVDAEDRTGNLLSIFDTVGLHHPSMTLINVVGLETSDQLTAHFANLGYVPARTSWFEVIAFRRLDIDWAHLPTFRLDAANWKTSDDVFDALFAVLKSPTWHGRNFNALNDSFVTGQINGIEVPYHIIVHGLEAAAPEARDFTQKLIRLITEFRERGCPVSIHIEQSPTSDNLTISR